MKYASIYYEENNAVPLFLVNWLGKTNTNTMKGLMMDSPLTITSILEFNRRNYPYKNVVSKLPNGSWHRYTYGDMYERTRKLAHALVHQLGIQSGDRVATFAWNHYAHLELYFAIPGIGAICHPINFRLSVSQMEYIMKHAEDKVVFVDASVIQLLEEVVAGGVQLQHIVVLNAGDDFKTTLPNVIHYEDLLANASTDVEWADVAETDACAMSYTSGTTGDPKGVVYSHRSTYLHALTLATTNVTGVSSRSKTLLIVPMFHAMGWGYPYMSLLTGADMVLPTIHLQPEVIVNILIQEKITHANGVPTIWNGVYNHLIAHPPAKKIQLEQFHCGGSALPVNLIAGYYKNFGVKATHLWGMTETSPLGTVSLLNPVHDGMLEEEQFKVLSKQGTEAPGLEIRIVNDEGKVLARDGKSVGEMQIRGPWVINSYYKMEDDGSRFSKDGWFKTGDVACIDEMGYMQIVDRTKDLIKSGGEWISSVELENAILAHPNVKEASVIAIPDDTWTERPLACVVLNDENQGLSINDLRDFLNKDFAKYQLPDRVAILDEIPKTSVGKFDKKEMRRQFSEGLLAC